MVEDESRETASEPAGGAPVNRDKRGDPGVIQGEAASPHEGESADEQASEGSTTAAPPLPPAPRKTGLMRAFLAGALGGLVISAAATGGGFYLFGSKVDLAQDDSSRLAALEAQSEHTRAAVESQANRDTTATASLDKRVSALEATDSRGALSAIDKRVSALEASNAASGAAGLDKRLGALEAANAVEEPKIASATRDLQNLTGQVKDLRADIDAARGEIPGLAAKLGKLEAGAAPSNAANDLSTITGRIDKIETQLASLKNETRATTEKAAAGDNSAGVAIVAEALRDKLASGAPFPTELAALEKLGVDPAKLAALKPLVNGAPTGAALAASFEAVQSKVLAAAAPKDEGGIRERLLAHMRDLVRVRDLGSTPGDDPPALASQVVADSRSGDISGALAAFAKLPDASRQAAPAWAAEARARQAADNAIQSIREAAVSHLAQSDRT